MNDWWTTEQPTPEQVAEANADNDQYLFECHIARLREWQYRKCQQLLDQIEQTLLNELRRRILLDSPSHTDTSDRPATD